MTNNLESQHQEHPELYDFSNQLIDDTIHKAFAASEAGQELKAVSANGVTGQELANRLSHTSTSTQDLPFQMFDESLDALSTFYEIDPQKAALVEAASLLDEQKAIRLKEFFYAFFIELGAALAVCMSVYVLRFLSTFEFDGKYWQQSHDFNHLMYLIFTNKSAPYLEIFTTLGLTQALSLHLVLPTLHINAQKYQKAERNVIDVAEAFNFRSDNLDQKKHLVQDALSHANRFQNELRQEAIRRRPAALAKRKNEMAAAKRLRLADDGELEQAEE